MNILARFMVLLGLIIGFATSVSAQSTTKQSSVWWFLSDIQVDGTLKAKFPPYYITNTVVISNSLDFAITGFSQDNFKIRYMNMFLSATNMVATSKRATITIYTRRDRLDDSIVYFDTNQLYWISLSTSVLPLNSSTSTVSDASGVILFDRYAVGDGTNFDFLMATNISATVIYWGCTNKYATTTSTLISHANYFTPIYFDDDSGASSVWARFTWNTPYTGAVSTIVRYGR